MGARRSSSTKCSLPSGHGSPRASNSGRSRIRAIVADGDTVVVVWDGRGIANDGVPYENSYAWIMRLRDGSVVDGTAFYDSIAFDESLEPACAPPRDRAIKA